jgi:cell wall-associated NlpC family hydrolase
MVGQAMTQLKGDEPGSNQKPVEQDTAKQLVSQPLPVADTSAWTNNQTGQSEFLTQVDNSPSKEAPKPEQSLQEKVTALLSGGFISDELAKHIMTKTSAAGGGLMQQVSTSGVEAMLDVLQGLKDKGLSAEHIKALVTMGFGKGGIAGVLEYIKKCGELTFEQLKARLATEDRNSILWLSENSDLLDKSLREIAPVEQWLKEERAKKEEMLRVQALQAEEKRRQEENPDTYSSSMMYQAVSNNSQAFGTAAVSGAAMSVLQAAAKYEGYVEGAGNRTKFGAEFGVDGQPWCGSFVNSIFKSVGVKIPQVVSTVEGAKSFRQMGLWADKNVMPQPGWVIFFNWGRDGTSSDQVDHVGIVVGVNPDGTIKTIEGNTSPSDKSNGGQVMFRNRSLADISGYGIPRAFAPGSSNGVVTV